MSYNWVSLGCGVIANQLAQSMEKQGRTLYGVVNRTYSKAIEFAEKYNIPNVYRNIDEVLHDENVDIIYISTPHNTCLLYTSHLFYLLDFFPNYVFSLDVHTLLLYMNHYIQHLVKHL